MSLPCRKRWRYDETSYNDLEKVPRSSDPGSWAVWIHLFYSIRVAFINFGWDGSLLYCIPISSYKKILIDTHNGQRSHFWMNVIIRIVMFVMTRTWSLPSLWSCTQDQQQQSRPRKSPRSNSCIHTAQDETQEYRIDEHIQPRELTATNKPKAKPMKAYEAVNTKGFL